MRRRKFKSKYKSSKYTKRGKRVGRKSKSSKSKSSIKLITRGGIRI